MEQREKKFRIKWKTGKTQMRNRVDYFGANNRVGILMITAFALEDMGDTYFRALDKLKVTKMHTYEDLVADRLKILFTAPSIPEVENFKPIPNYYIVVDRNREGGESYRLEMAR